jgi:putative ABC transport system permease protein
LAGVGGSIVGAVIPARSAARATPIDAFRPTATYEWRDPTRPSRQLITAAIGVTIIAVGVALAFLRPADQDVTDPMVLVPIFTVYVGTFVLMPPAIPLVARIAASLLGRSPSAIGRSAADALRANPRRTTVNVMALLVPVAAVVLTTASFGSSLSGIDRLARGVVGAPLNVDADSYTGVLGGFVASQPLVRANESVLQAVPGVRAVLPYQNANIRLPNGSGGVVYGVPLTAAGRAGVPDMVRFAQLADDPSSFTKGLGSGEIAASRFAARNLGLEVGGQVRLPTPSGTRAFTVAALFDDWTWQGTFALDLDTYRHTWGDDGAYRYGIVPTAGASVVELRSRLDAAIRRAGMQAQVHTRDHAIAEIQENTTIFLPLTRGMTLASLLFAALALGNAAFTAVTEQRWTLALQRALGMSRRQINRSLALEAVTIGVLGAVGGAAVGVGLGLFAVRLLGYQVALALDYRVPWSFAAVSTVLGVLVALAATAWPRHLARRRTIIESLRFE